MEIVGVGLNAFGQLGIGSRKRKDSFVPTKYGVAAEGEARSEFNADDVFDIQCCSHATVVLNHDGSVQLSGSVADILSPIPEQIHLQFPQKAIQIACGRKHVLLLFEGGCVMSWGTGYFGQLGHGNDNSLEDPMMIAALTPQALGQRCVNISAGGNHSAVVTENGIGFMWGLNKSSQCGVNIKSDVITTPKPLDLKRANQLNGNKPVYVDKIVCGRNHSGFISTDKRIYTWGAIGFGRTGLNVSANVKIQSTPCELPGIKANILACGDFHMVALSDNGNIYSWGYGWDSQPGHSSLLHVRRPRKLDYFHDKGIVIDDIQCGSSYTIVKDTYGYVYGWGYADGGWLGIKPLPKDDMPMLESDDAALYPIIANHVHIQQFDALHNVISPSKITILKNKIVHKIRCGGAHSIFFTSIRPSITSTSTVFDESFDRNDDDDEGDDEEGVQGVVNSMMLGDSDSDDASAGAKSGRIVNSKTGKK
jgi:alpha-tubulin suppressor-like RCC1 family protein